MDRVKDVENHGAGVTERVSPAYVPPLQLTEGQPPPIAANGGLSYMSFDRDGDAGTAAATEAALHQIAEGEGQAVIDMLDNAPPGPIETKWGVGFRSYAECLEYIRANNIEAPEGGVALPLRYTVYEQPSYSIVSSNALWRDPAREAEAKALRKEEQDIGRRYLYFPQVLRDARRIAGVLPRSLAQQPRVHGQAWRCAGALRVQVQELLRRGGGGTRVLPGDGEAPPGVFPGRDGCARVQPRRV